LNKRLKYIQATDNEVYNSHISFLVFQIYDMQSFALHLISKNDNSRRSSL